MAKPSPEENGVMLAKSLHKLASPLLYGSGAYRRMWQGHGCRQPFTVVLVYHRVVEEGPSPGRRFAIERGLSAGVFEAQLRFMLKYFVPVRAAQALEPAPAPLRFAVTLDDGYEDNFRVAAPILRRLGVPATFYVVSEFVGSDRLFWWEQLAETMRETRLPRLDVQAILPDLVRCEALTPVLPLHTDVHREHAYEFLSAALRGGRHDALPGRMTRLSEALEVRPRGEGREYGLMNWRQLRELVAQGHDIGGHTATHSNVAGLDSGMLQREVVTSLATIEHHLDTPVLSFAYPYGHFNDDHNLAGEAVAAAGCRAAFTGRKGVVQGQSNAFELPRSCLNRRFPFAWAYNVQDMLNRSSPPETRPS